MDAEKRRRQRKGRGAAARSSPERRLEGSLLEVLRDCLRRAGHRAGDGEAIVLSLRAVARAGEQWRLEADPSLAEQIDEAVHEAAAKTDAYRQGKVYCYRCESPECAHSAPPDPGVVFAGYSPTGIPLWRDLVQFLVERRHPRADALCDGTSRTLVAAFVEAESLRSRQLGVFGGTSRTYDILGQVVFGHLWFRHGEGKEARREKTALTLQAAVVKKPGGGTRCVLNALGRLSDGSEACERLEGPMQLRVLDVVSSARRQIARLRRGAGGRQRLVADAAAVLRRTAGALGRLDRQSSRRTRHAEQRVTERRPTSRALEEARRAGGGRLLWDERTSSVVVLGSRGRVHIFSPRGRHVTSLSLRGEEIESRKRRKRWRHLDSESLRLFRDALQAAPEG